MAEIIYAGSKREEDALKEIKVLYHQHLDELNDKSDWLDVDESDRDKAITLYRVWHNEGYQCVEDEGNVIDDWMRSRREYLQGCAEQNYIDAAEHRAMGYGD